MVLKSRSFLFLCAVLSSAIISACDDPKSDEPLCGNGQLDGQEACDQSSFVGNNAECKNYDTRFGSGSLTCTSECKVDTTACILAGAPKCGNGVVDIEGEKSEDCDGDLFLLDETQCAEWDNKFGAGTVTCNDDCTINFSACTSPRCGDGVVSEINGKTEDCDGSAFYDNQTTCVGWDDKKYATGNVTCNSNCTVNFDTCVAPKCGDGIVNQLDGKMEDCDGTAFLLDQTTCVGWNEEKYKAGNVSCKADCSIDFTACTPTCGDNVLQPHEDCDNNLFFGDSNICNVWDPKYSAGNVTCGSDCKVDFAACTSKCGNGELESYGGFIEQCDSDKYLENKTSCSAWDEKKYGAGDVSCNNDCTINYDACKVPKCDDGIVNEVDGKMEDCDGTAFLLDQTTCVGWNDKLYSSGDVSCKADCSVDFSQCIVK